MSSHQMFSLRTARFNTCAVSLAAALLLLGCGGDDSGEPVGGGTCSANSGGPVLATSPDMHCTIDGNETKQQVDESACAVPAGGLPPDDGDGAADGGTGFGPTMNGSEGDDDACKYHLKWSTTCITENKNFTVTVAITTKSSGKPLVTSAAKLDQELYLGDTHLAPNTNPVYKTTSTPGTYTLGPLKVDQPGKWTVRFHIRPDCVDLTGDSPHGHAAFYINVP